MKKALCLIASSLILLSTCSCSSKPQDSISNSESSELSESLSAVEAEPTNFDIYKSNTYIASGNNFMLTDVNEVTYRTYFPIEEYGELEYCFYFSNTVDSTYSDGSVAYAGRPGAEFKIISASISDGGTSNTEPITNTVQITFDGGNVSKDVGYMETFWTDPVTYNIEEGHFLVWEWTLSGSYIPATSMSSLTYTSADSGSGFSWTSDVPVPNLIGAKRDVKLNIATIGDSITQGCQTTSCGFDFWVANIARDLGEDYSVWNLGLGWSRSSDCALNGDWLNRAKTADIVTVAFGTNDVISGKYANGRPDTSEEMLGYLDTIVSELQAAGCKVIVFTEPPFDMGGTSEQTRVEFNAGLAAMAQEKECELFDFAQILADPADFSKALYNGHPNAEGCLVIADEFLNQYSTMLEID